MALAPHVVVPKWSPEETAVRARVPSACTLPSSRSPSFDPRLQAAARAWTGACERWSSSPETYRIQVANQEYPDALKKVCGADGAGQGTNQFKFPTQARTAKKGGDWTMELSAKMRPAKSTSIMAQGKKVVTKVLNVYALVDVRASGPARDREDGRDRGSVTLPRLGAGSLLHRGSVEALSRASVGASGALADTEV